ncbi:preprotein translocase subunit SecA [Gaopeijia maritima]|uniref:Protein translocase subunit SecA n=1 Tax=Gaopeijia maritima TaxID=3119007 RepID=A0ABU9E825_9BACT
MLKSLVKTIIGNRHDREVKKLQPVVDEINRIYEGLSSLSDDQLRGKTDEFRARIREATAEIEEQIAELRTRKGQSEDPEEREQLSVELGTLEADALDAIEQTLEDILPEAFAVVKEACRRLQGQTVEFAGTSAVWNMVPYDVQLIGGISLHRGKVAEMQTGEGKTLVATMPLYLNALAGKGAHLVTVNSYLATRDAEWMSAIYGFLGLTVDVIDKYQPGSPERREAYGADITYGTNNEYGFDYLRDNMVHTLEQRVQRGHHYAIIDEVDSILIDEARTPLIISGPVGRDTATPFKQYNPLVKSLFSKQLRLTNDLVSQAEADLAEGNTFEAGEKLLAVKRGTPRHKRLLKMFADDPSLQTLVQKVEADYMREKRLHDIDEMLLFAMDEKGHNVHLSEAGLDELSPNDSEAFVVPDLSEAIGAIEHDESLTVDERRARLAEMEEAYAAKNQKLHVIHQLLKAYALYQKDEKYIIGEDGSVVIVDEFTGRQMAGRRWSDGLHQAVEAKEGVEIKGETQTLATITIQNYFRMYDKLAGMTGTAETEENEFHQIYDLDVMVIPTNRPVVRDDRNDLIFRTKREKYNAILDEIERLHKLELPVLVGTTNVEVSETLSRMLKRRGLPHNVLNAKQHKRESEIVAEAGRPGAVTIATNMAGRGTDIKLGDGVRDDRTVDWARERELDLFEVQPVDPTRYDEKVESRSGDTLVEDGGLHIIGSERHESRRIDRQLRGRAGRQGDPGATQFFLSLEDDLMRLFGGMERIANAMEKMGAEEGEVITHGLVTKSIERAQKRVEGNNFEARKRLLDYDDVMNQQREVVYDLRLFALQGGEDLKGEMWEMIEGSIRHLIDEYVPAHESPERWELAGLRRRMLMDFFVVVDRLPEEEDPDHTFDREEVADVALEATRSHFHRKIEGFGELGERVMSYILLSTIDDKWKDHLYDLDHLKASIGFRGWGQKDPLVEYKKEAFDMFVDLMADLRTTVTRNFFRAQVTTQPPRPMPRAQRMTLSGPSEGDAAAGAGASAGARPAAPAPRGPRVEDTGIAARARADSGPAAAGLGPATDVSRLATNRGEEAAKSNEPATASDEPGRNDPCPCGSGKKYKKCCGRAG